LGRIEVFYAAPRSVVYEFLAAHLRELLGSTALRDLSNPVPLAAYAEPDITPNSNDSELLLTLPPGGYTAEVTGADGGTGVALCAIYQLP
jgi:hypothetical protein